MDDGQRILPQGKNFLPERGIGHKVPTTGAPLDRVRILAIAELITGTLQRRQPGLVDELEQTRGGRCLGLNVRSQRAFPLCGLQKIVEIGAGGGARLTERRLDITDLRGRRYACHGPSPIIIGEVTSNPCANLRQLRISGRNRFRFDHDAHLMQFKIQEVGIERLDQALCGTFPDRTAQRRRIALP